MDHMALIERTLLVKRRSSAGMDNSDTQGLPRSAQYRALHQLLVLEVLWTLQVGHESMDRALLLQLTVFTVLWEH